MTRPYSHKVVTWLRHPRILDFERFRDMRLTTIWTLPTLTLSERLRRTRDWAFQEVAHRLPRRLAYWSLIDTGVRHIRSGEVVPEVPFTTLLQRAGEGVESA